MLAFKITEASMGQRRYRDM